MSNHTPDDFFACSPSCVDRGADWTRTPCLCGCHYFGLTSRQMAKQTADSPRDTDEVYAGAGQVHRASRKH